MTSLYTFLAFRPSFCSRITDDILFRCHIIKYDFYEIIKYTKLDS